MAATTLQLSSQPAELDREIPVEIQVTTDASDYTVSVEGNTDSDIKIKVEKLEGNKLRLTGIQDGTYKVTVNATASGYDTTTVTWYTVVKVFATELTATYQTLDSTGNPTKAELTGLTGLNVGERKEITVTTNSTDGYTVTSSNDLYARIINKTDTSFVIEAVGVGDAKIEVKTTKKYSTEVVLNTDIAVTYKASTDDAGNPTAIKLVNTSTGRTVTIQTSNNDSNADITLSLPGVSGTLITEETLESDIKMIKRPSIITPPNNTDNWKGFFIASAYEVNLGNSEAHESTTWEASHDKNFTEIFYLKKVSLGDLNDINTLEKTCLEDIGSHVACYVRVKYSSKTHDSEWSEPVYIRTAVISLHGIEAPLKTYTRPASETQGKTYGDFASDYFGAYYGIVEHSKLVDDYDYRGTWNTIKTSYTKTNYNDSSTLPIRMKAGFQVIHNDQLWYALKEDAPTEAANMIEPGTDDTMWKVETRTALGTPARVAREIGIGFNNPDSNCDGLSSGSTTLGARVNDNLGYIKYVYNGKLCYTPVKPICNTICWNDLGKREAVYGTRTIRLGTELFMVRLMKEEEYKELFTRLTDGTYANEAQDTYDLTQKVWIEDFQEGAVRKYMTGTSTVGTQDPKVRTNMSWRFVLEYIPEHSAPYNNLELNFPNVQKAKNEKFIYDRYSDTGYFGQVDALDFINGTELNTKLGFTSGSEINPNYPWFKFYWHGQIVFMRKSSNRYNLSYNSITTHNCHHGMDMGGKGKQTITINGCTYRAMNSIGANETPYTRTGFTEADLSKLPTANLELHKGKYSQWNELMYRISEGYLGYTEVNGGTQWNNGYMYYHGGYQIGDNWATFTADELITRYSSSNGTACWQRDLSNSTILNRGFRGVGDWSGYHALSRSDANCAFRCLLSLTTNYNVRS